MQLTNDDLNNIRKINMENLMEFWDRILEPKITMKEELKETELQLKKGNQNTRDYYSNNLIFR